MRTLFLADAHLHHPDDRNYRYLLEFLAEQTGKVDRLVLLGDIFEFWVGYRHIVFANYVPLLERLGTMHRAGTQLIFVEGNHDFHMGPYFSEQLNCRILPDGGTLEIDGLKLFVAHGDQANPNDTGYRLLRAFWRSALTRLLIRIVPPDLAWDFEAWASRRSQQARNGKSRRTPALDILLPYARARLEAGHDAVITGHFHEPSHQQLGEGQLIALGDWIDQFSYAVCEDGELSLHTWSPAPAA